MIKTAFSATMVRDNIIANLIAVCPDGIIGVDLHGTVVICNAKRGFLHNTKLSGGSFIAVRCNDWLGMFFNRQFR